MLVNITALNGLTINEFDLSVPVTLGNGLTPSSGGNYTLTPNGFGNLSSFDNWNGTVGSPAAGDILSYNLTVVDTVNDVIQYTFQASNGTGGSTTNPGSGGVGAEVIAYNDTGVLVETITGYAPGDPASFIASHLSGNFLSFGDFDLSQFEAGYTGPTSVAFGQTGSSTFLGIQCFGAGTKIACADGEVAVEALKIGDVVALADGGTLPIVWIGRRRVDCRRHKQPDTVLPVRIAPGAFGDLEPKRPLYLSPEHAVLRDGVLIPIRLLMNGTSIRQVERDIVTYYHIELARHEILLAEGLPVESFLAAACDRSWFDNTPSSAPRGLERVEFAWECQSREPLILTGAGLEAVRRKLAERAGESDAPAHDHSPAARDSARISIRIVTGN